MLPPVHDAQSVELSSGAASVSCAIERGKEPPDPMNKRAQSSQQPTPMGLERIYENPEARHRGCSRDQEGTQTNSQVHANQLPMSPTSKSKRQIKGPFAVSVYHMH